MSTVALQNVWNTLLGYNLSTTNKRWLAEHLIAQVKQETAEQAKPYTMAEIDAIGGRCRRRSLLYARGSSSAS